MFGLLFNLGLLIAALFKFSLFSTGGTGSTDGEGSTGTPTPDLTSGANTITQADVDRIAGEARKEGKAKALKDFLTELGFEKPDDLKTLIADAKKRQEAEMSEMDKARKDIEAEVKRREAIEQELNQLRLERQQALIDRAVETALQKSNAKKPGDVLDLMKVRGKLNDLLSEDGQLDEKKLTAAIEAFKKDNAEYFGSGNPGSPSNSGAKPPIPTDKNLKDAATEHMRRLGGS